MKSWQKLIVVFASIFTVGVIGFIFFKKESKPTLQATTFTTQNYLAYSYTLLKSNYQLNLSSERFSFFLKKYNYNAANIKTYSDSLQVVLMAELNDWQKARSAHLQITYTWQRVGQHIWQTEAECQQLAQQIGITHPYELISFLKNQSNANQPLYKTVYSQLRTRLQDSLQNASVCNLPADLLLKKAFANHPSVLAMKHKAMEHNH